jgi:hypothetical protein
LFVLPCALPGSDESPHLRSTCSRGRPQVEATKFTEVGFHGRDVDQIIRDLVDSAITLQRAKMRWGIMHVMCFDAVSVWCLQG